MRLKPAPDHKVRHPHPPYAFLRPEGENIDDSPYWRRRLVRGDVVLVEDPPDDLQKKRAELPKAEEK